MNKSIAKSKASETLNALEEVFRTYRATTRTLGLSQAALDEFERECRNRAEGVRKQQVAGSGRIDQVKTHTLRNHRPGGENRNGFDDRRQLG
jgi:hypothetical protein